jgi:hypothetical protein
MSLSTVKRTVSRSIRDQKVLFLPIRFQGFETEFCMSYFRIIMGLAALFVLAACKIPEQRQAYYPNGFLKERYWVFQDSGREVMNGLYTSWFPNGEKEVEILYNHGAEFTKTYYSERGTLLGTVKVASREP